jgi:hypothetical protein
MVSLMNAVVGEVIVRPVACGVPEGNVRDFSSIAVGNVRPPVDDVCKPASMISELPADLTFMCPRCAGEVSERLYGPCRACRAQLRSAFAGEARDVEVEEYVPKMNVTPNAVASRE